MSLGSYLETKDAKDCTGCGACAFSCPTGAIAMAQDACGFEYPRVDESKCVRCDKCLRSCHMHSPDALKHGEPLACYGAMDKDAGSLRRSASGGAATALSRCVVDAGGVVYGCVAEREDVHHERLTDCESLWRAQGSKYVQSDLSRAFGLMRRDLEAGLDVLFVGTPCQCAAVKALFSKFENLMAVDLVCEGVPSRKMYADFLDDLEVESGERVTDFRFRDKRGGWSTKNAVVIGGGGEPLECQPHSYYYYYYWFSKALILRDSCYACPYACGRRTGDVTVGDLWGAETAGLEYGLRELEAGISCALANTERGCGMLKAAELGLRECGLRTVARSNGCLEGPSACDREARKRVLTAYAEDGAAGMRREYEGAFTAKRKLKADLAANMPLSLRVALKRAKAALKGGRR